MSQARPGATSQEPWRDPAAKPFVRIENITKVFDSTYAVDNVSLDIFQGEFFCLLGGSGCGKSTLLRMLAGLERPDSGRILIDGTDMTRVPPYERPVNMMFQSYALFPHMSVEQNIAFGLKQERLPKAEVTARVAEMLALVRLERFAKRKPDQLSGGQRQRVALARSLAKHPKLLLLDEPLAALDKKLREHTQFELINIQERVGTTFIMVTHDQEEAMTVSSRMAVMDEGRIVQVGAPASVYEYPANRFVAEFIGSVNILEGRVLEQQGDQVRIQADSAGCELLMDHIQPLPEGTPVSVALRPEKLQVTTEAPTAPHNWVKGTVAEYAYLGDVSIYHVRLPGGQKLRVQLTNLARLTETPLTWDQDVYLSWQPGSGVVFPA
ncbi:MAG: polyamine ABC transporter ATP-binding protein [Gammaproteobacteria bacterium]|nr:polyamine ABC transporter ATP-binding protein [Gammaproteobacteria bacterium]MCW9057854.1 polyamine ABC transporter ATP-binding protein [Gammaproteobacteria bacterium]